MVIKLNLMAAVCENMGIGKNNELPWRLRSEMNYFTRMTTVTKNEDKKNVVIMGRKTWDSIPSKYKPLEKRINFVLSRSDIDLNEYEDSYAFKSMEQALDRLKEDDFKKKYENVWVIGGSLIYKEALHSKYFHRLYLTEIKKKFDCDAFFPPLPNNLLEITDPEVPEDVQVESDVQFVYKVYECQPTK